MNTTSLSWGSGKRCGRGYRRMSANSYFQPRPGIILCAKTSYSSTKLYNISVCVKFFLGRPRKTGKGSSERRRATFSDVSLPSEWIHPGYSPDEGLCENTWTFRRKLVILRWLDRQGNQLVGAWRSLVAYLHGVQVVAGSNPAAPTKFNLANCWDF